MKSFFATVLLSMFSLLPVTVMAQYEGEINFMIHNPNSGMAESANMNLVFTKNRIFIDSDISMNVMAGLRARGVLARNDLQDFIIITTDDEGLKVAKSELDGLVNIMNRIQNRPNHNGRAPFDWESRVTETGKTRTIQGIVTQEYILKGDNDGEFISVWLTDEIKVDWGLLLEAWYSSGTMQFEHEIPIEMVMNNTSFPLLVEAHKNNEVVFRAVTISVNNRNFDRTKTRIPESMKLIGLSDLMMNFFRQQR